MSALIRLALGARRHPIVVLLVLGLVTAFAGWLLPHVRFESDLTALFPEADESVRIYREVARREGGSRTLLIVLRGEDVGATLPEVVASLRASPHLESVIATQEEFAGPDAGTFRAAPVWFLPAETLDRLAARMNGEGADEALAEARARLAEDPLAGRELLLKDPLGLRWILEEGARKAAPFALDRGSPYLVTPDRRVALVKVLGRKEPLDVPFSQALLADVEHRLAGREFDLIGGYVVAREEESRIRGDLERSSVLSFALVALFLIASFRGIVRPGALMIGVNLAVFWTLAFGGVLFGPLTPLAAGSAAILVGLGVDPGIHLLARYESERRTLAAEPALAAAARATARPILLSALTIIAAFLTLAASSFRGLRGFGSMLAFGLALAVVNSFTIQPVALRGRFDRAGRAARSFVVRLLERLHGSRFRWLAAAALIGAALAGWVLVAARGVPLDVGLASLRPKHDPMDEARARLEREVGLSAVPVALLVPADVPLAEVASATAALEAAGAVKASLGPHRSVASAERARLVAEFRARTRGWIDRARAAIERAGFAPEPFADGLAEMDRRLAADPQSPASGPAENLVQSSSGPLRVIHLFVPRTLSRPEARAEFTAAVDAAFGRPMLSVSVYSLGDLLRATFERELTKLLLLSSAVVVLIVLLFSGGLVAGLATLLPAAIAFGLALGHLALFEGSIHLGNFVALPLLAGICVDNGIHMMATRREGEEDPFGVAGIALWRNYATTALGFGALLIARTPGLVSLGATLLIGCSAAFVVSLLVLAPRRSRPS